MDAGRGMNAIAKQEDWGTIGDAMRSLPNDQVRAFVRAYVVHPPGQGALLNSYIAAGYGKPDSKRETLSKNAWHLAHDPRVVAAVREEAVKVLRLSHPEAVNTLLECMRDPNNKDRWKCALAILERTDPTMTHNRLDITHRVVDLDQEALDDAFLVSRSWFLGERVQSTRCLLRTSMHRERLMGPALFTSALMRCSGPSYNRPHSI